MSTWVLRKTILLIIMCLPVTHLTGCVAIYKSYQGRIIDAETKQPIEGVVVSAGYYKKSFGGPGGPISSIINVRETLTDKNGIFDIPSYITLIAPFSWQVHTYFKIVKPQYQVHEDGPLVTAVRSYLSIAVIKTEHREGLLYAGLDCNINTGMGYVFLPLKDAKAKLEKLEVPLDCPKEVGPDPYYNYYSSDAMDDLEWAYTIVELSKLKTKQERRSNIIYFSIWSYDHKDQANLIRLIDEEKNSVGSGER